MGTLGGGYSDAFWINDEGEATGYGFLPGNSTYHAVLFKNGKRLDLGTLSGFPNSTGIAINNQEQIAGNVHSADFSLVHATLWENGSMIDLNVFAPAGSGITLNEAVQINDAGVIGLHGTVATGSTHLFLLVPCDEDSPGGCESQLAPSGSGAASVGQAAGAALPAFGKPAGWRGKPFGRTNPMFGQQPGPEN